MTNLNHTKRNISISINLATIIKINIKKYFNKLSRIKWECMGAKYYFK